VAVSVDWVGYGLGTIGNPRSAAVAIVEGDHDLVLCSSINIARWSFSVPQLRGEMVMLDIARF
jgi:hypothetical protein